MDGIEPGSLVIVNITNPREKAWGVLLRLDAIGVVIRGLDLNSVEDWLTHQRLGADQLITASTFLIPTHRILRIDLEEEGGVVESFSDRYTAACGGDVRDALLGAAEVEERSDA
jgi:uncharacterized protein (UPF0248 family)